MPPPKFKDPEDQIPCSSPAQLAAHVGEMQTMFLQPESEHTWERFGKGLNKLAALTRGGAYKLDTFQSSVGSAVQGGLGEKIVQCVLSERAALSRPAVELVTSIAVCLGTHFNERLQRLYIPALLDLIRRTNNIVRERAEHALYSTIRSCPQPSLIGYLSGAARDINAKLRRSINVAAAIAVDSWKAGGRVDDIEMMIKQLTADKDADVRKAARDLWDRYKVTWPERVLTFIAPMSPTTKKRLDIKDTDTYPLSASGTFSRSPSAAGLASSSTGAPAAVPAKKMGAKSFIAQRKAELARQAAAARASAVSDAQPLSPDEPSSAGPSPAKGASPSPPPAAAEPLPPLPPSPPPAARLSTSYLPNFDTDDRTTSPSLLSQLPPLPPSQPSTPLKTPSKSPANRPSPLAPATPTPTATATAESPAPAARSTPLRPPRSPARMPSPVLEPQQAGSSASPAPNERPVAPLNAAPFAPSAAFSTPLHPASRALRHAAAFQDSPPPPLLLAHASPKHRDLLGDGRPSNGRAAREFGEWRKTLAALREGLPSSPPPSRPTAETLDDLASAETLRALVDFALSHPVAPPSSDGQLADADAADSTDDGAQAAAVWKEGALFELLLEKVLAFLSVNKTSPDVERCLVLLEALVDNQWPLFEGHEGPLFDALLQLRSLPRPVVRQATTALCSTASAQLSPIFALYTLSSTLRALLPPPSPSDAQRGLAFSADADAVAQPFAFGLLELGRVVMRLPAEVVSEELPRLRDLILPGLYSSLLPVRESAATAVLAAQLVIRDESLVFSLLEGLTSDKINLLTYMFEKNRVREGAGSAAEGWERVEKEMRRLSLHL